MKSIVLSLLLLISTGVSAEPLKTTADTRRLADTMVDHFVKTEFDAGLALAAEHWPLPQVEIDGLANQIATQWPVVNQRYGRPTGKEFAHAERIGDSFVRYYYLHKFENHAIYWKITFYRPTDTWKVNGVTYLDTLDELFWPVE